MAAAWPKLPSSSLKAETASSVIAKPCESTSTSRNTRTPTENIASATRVREPSSCRRATGRPR